MVRTHTVVAGETLSALALRFYGDAELYRLIATASGIADPDAIDVGQRLIFPDFTRYTVVAGDTLSALASRFYGDAELYRLIATASGIADPDAINVGQRLIIPDITRYTVVAGDTLSALASRFYGDASLYPLIATANGIADPDAIDAGQVLVIFAGRSDGFGLTIVDRNENDPRLKYYRFQTAAIGWNPGVNVLLPDDYHTSGRTYPVLYMLHGGADGLPPVRLSGHPRPDRRKADHRRDARRRARGLVLQPGQLVRRPAELGDLPHRPADSPGSRRTSERTPSTTAVRSPGFRWVGSVR